MQGDWVGVELDEDNGKNDGVVKGTRYFSCPQNRGLFARPDKLIPEALGLAGFVEGPLGKQDSIQVCECVIV